MAFQQTVATTEWL